MKTWLVIYPSGHELKFRADTCSVDVNGNLCLYADCPEETPVIPGSPNIANCLVAKFAAGQWAGYMDCDLYAKIIAKYGAYESKPREAEGVLVQESEVFVEDSHGHLHELKVAGRAP